VYVSFWLGLSCLCSVVFRRAATSAIVGIASWLVLAVFGALFIGLLADAISPVPDQATAEEVLANLRAEENIGRIFPANLYDDATIVLLNPLERSTGIILLQQLDFADLSSPLSLEQSLLLAWPQTVALVAITVICFAAAYIRFMRQEIRA
jgi:ABC-2 type transport system permease protein